MIDIEKLENLPKRIGIIKDVKVNDIAGYSYNVGTSSYPRVNGYYPWTIIDRILTHFYQKDVNEAFSHYCKQVPKFCQSNFWEQFEPRRRRWRTWWLDENNCIQNDTLVPSYNGPYYIYSSDYKAEWKHKETGHLRSDFTEVYVRVAKYTNHLVHYKYKPWKTKGIGSYIALPEEFELVKVSGYKLTFASKNDPRYLRIMYERETLRRKNEKARDLERKNKQYSFLTDSEKEKRKQRAIDLVNRDRHGFDDESFTGMPYHGQQRKTNEKVSSTILDRTE